MSITFQIPIFAEGMSTPTVDPASPSILPTSAEDTLAFSPSVAQGGIIQWFVPSLYTGAGSLKVDIYSAANTTTPADTVRWTLKSEFRTPNADESVDADAWDAAAVGVTQAFTDGAYELVKSTITLSPDTTPAVNDLARLLLVRDVTHVDDDLAVSAHVRAIVIYEETA